jgi:propionyl-CoA carboxylase alpha chain
MISKLLIANRGEIARRIIRTCNEMGISTVAVFSDADADAPFVSEADEAIALGGNTPAESYLRGDAIIAAARSTGADAIHPGYGFLAENADFAEACAAANLIFVGPSPSTIAKMGDKLAAKEIAEALDVPTLRSVEVGSADAAHAADQAESIGYPVLVKASAGGGGKGMRIVRSAELLIESIESAVREAEAAFGNGTVFLEKYLDAPRHIEIQVFGDTHGTLTHLFERECSIQRRHQKIIEESPSTAVGGAQRAEMGAAALKICEAVDYVGAGTVEFLFSDNRFYFLEMNTRLQVEHPVTELVTGLDLVRLQIEVAEGSPLPPEAVSPTINGHAIEARLYAEDPRNGYLPSIGRIERFQIGGARVDSAVEAGSEVSVFYDPMIAKVVVHAQSRRDAIRLLTRSLTSASIHGVTTNRDLLVGILTHAEFEAGSTDTAFLERNPASVLATPRAGASVARRHAVAAALVGQHGRRSNATVLPDVPTGWRNSPSQPQGISFMTEHGEIHVSYLFTRHDLDVAVDGQPEETSIHALGDGHADLQFGPQRLRYQVATNGKCWFVDGPDGSSSLVELPRFPTAEAEVALGSMVSPMPGKVIRVDVRAGDEVETGTSLVIIEAMKMEHTVAAPAHGTVASVSVAVGEQVQADQVLVVIDAD